MLTPPLLPSVAPVEETMESMISCIPTPRSVKQDERPFFLITGLPSTGKTTLAARLASEMSTELINLDTAISHMRSVKNIGNLTAMDHDEGEADQQDEIIEDAEKPSVINTADGFPREIFDHISAGKEISTAVFLEYFENLTVTDESTFRGITLDGLPVGSIGSDSSNLHHEDIECLVKILANKPSNFRLVLLNLTINAPDLIARRKKQFIDPVTNIIYSGAQVTYSIKRRKEGYSDDAPDVEMEISNALEKETWSTKDSEENVAKAADNEEENELDANEDEDNEHLKSDISTKKKINLCNKTTWPIIPQEIIDRLIRRIEDLEENIVKDIVCYQEKMTYFEKFQETYFDQLHTVNIDANQHPDIVFRHAISQLESLGFSAMYKPVVAHQIILPEGTLDGMIEEDSFYFLTKYDLQPGEPIREGSVWGSYCPVRHLEEGVLARCNHNFPVCYRGVLYFTSSDQHAARMVTHPDRYLACPPTTPPMRLCVLGGPFSGKTTQSKMLSRIYRLKLICIDEILTNWDNDPFQKSLRKRIPLYREISRILMNGEAIDSWTMVEIIKMKLADYDDPMMNNGWVFDGFPRTLEDVKFLIQADLIPKHMIILQNDINDGIVRNRIRNYMCNSKNGRDWDSTSRIMPHPPSTRNTTPKSGSRRLSRPMSSAIVNLRQSVAPRKSTYEKDKPGTTSNSDAPKSADPSEKSVQGINYTPALKILMLPYFDHLYNGFKEDFSGITKMLTLNNCLTVTVPSFQSKPTILALIQVEIDPFVPRAKALSDEEILELPAQIEYGYTKDFCPFALRQVGILKKGDSTIVAKYLNRYYLFSSEDARSAFLLEPHNFVNYKGSMKAPPPRLFFLGPKGAGTSTCIASLHHWNVPVILFTDFLDDFLKSTSMSPEMQEEFDSMNYEVTGALPTIIVQELITAMFTREPYATKGFLVEGFPRNKIEAEILVKHNYYVDAFVIMRVDSEVAAKRNLRDKKKNALLRKTAARREYEESGSLISKKEFLEASKEFEELEIRSDEIQEELVAACDKENLRIFDTLSALEGYWTCPIIDVETSKCTRPVFGALKRSLLPYFEYVGGFNSRDELEGREAEILLSNGIKTYSAFGTICPASLKKSQSALKRPQGTLPVLYRDHIYFLRGENNREVAALKEFIANVEEFLSQPEPQVAVKPKVCILGPPKSGKTIITEKLCQEYELIHLTVPVILESIVQDGGNTLLSQSIALFLKKGEAVPEDLVIDAVIQMTSSGICQAKGWILDGFPQTLHEAKILESKGFIPHVIFNFSVPNEEIMIRTRLDHLSDILNATPRLNINHISEIRNLAYHKDIDEIRKLFSIPYGNWQEIDGTKSKWFIKNLLQVQIESSTRRRQNYVELKTKGRAAPVGNIGINIRVIKEKAGKFKNFCPVSLLEHGELIACSDDTRYMAEYQGRYYNMASQEELEMFLQDPNKYVNTQDLPTDMPEIRDSSILVFPRTLELQGYCPVTYAEGPPGIVPGDIKHIAEYQNKLYSFVSREQLDKFMRTPWDFIDLVLPKKLPPKQVFISIGQLPLIGYLEQTVARALTNALLELGKFRPKYPYKSLEESASYFLGLYLKSQNPKSKEWVQKSFKEKLTKFKKTCNVLDEICRLANVKVDEKTPFIESINRAKGLDEKLEDFFKLAAN